MNRILVFVLTSAFIFNYLDAQNLNRVELPEMQKPQVRKEISLPDIPGYKTLRCDFHMHTVFSDGLVWPSIRVKEAWQEGLDAIAITDHIEYTPHSGYMKGDFNSSYEIAKPYADRTGLILTRAAEITRSMPPGHFNAIFLKDANALDTEKVEDALQAAADQGAFIFWNHPGWKAQQPDTTVWMEVHEQLYEAGLINGIEVFNSSEYYPVAINWCLEKDLTMLGNSDTHGVIAYTYDLEKGHRPMTLVFAEEYSKASLKEAMFARRTLAWFNNRLIGQNEILKEFLKASLELESTRTSLNMSRSFRVSNLADIPYILSDNEGNEYTIPALSVIFLNFPDDILSFQVTNLFSGTGKNLKIGYDEFIQF